MDRKAELQRKREKLEEMRKAKKEKEDQRKNQGSPVKSSPKKAESRNLRSETEKMLQDLGIPEADPAGGAASITTSSSSADGVDGTSQSVLSSTSSSTGSTVRSMTSSLTKLSVSKMAQTNIAPKEMVAYNKETQTVVDTAQDARYSSDFYELVPRYVGRAMSIESRSSSLGTPAFGSPAFPHSHLEWEDEFVYEDEEAYPAASGGLAHPALAAALAAKQQPKFEAKTEPKEEEKPPVRELSLEERQLMMNSEPFLRFFDRSSRIMERALAERDDGLFTDYTGADEDLDVNQQAGETIKLAREFFDERWSKHRTVTCMDWSPQYPELLVASYNANEEAPHEPDGVALVWNQKFKKNTPEFIFHCQSAVMSCCFAKFHPNLVVGGTYSGQVVIWDNRSHKRTPVQRTALSASSHTHPVYCMAVVGTQNAHNLLSISTDGKLCSWSLDMLSQPQESLELQQHKQFMSAAATCVSFFSGDANNFVIGSEEGLVYTGCRHGSKAGVAESLEGHQGPVTGIHTHSVPGPVDFSHYFLSSSFDWTVKLWSSKESKPVYSFEDNSDYVYDVRWSPVHPALFATVDGSGRLDIWNLNTDTEVPAASEQVEGGVGLNQCRWHGSGHSIAVGDDVGRIRLYDVAEHLSAPRADEWTRLVHTLQELHTEQDASVTTPQQSTTAAPSSIASFLSPMR